MSAKGAKGAESDKPAAKRRLFDIVTEELSPVDFPANEEPWLLCKSKEQKTMPVQTNKESSGVLVIPASIKKAVLPNLAASVERSMAFVKAVQQADESDKFEGLGEVFKSELGNIKTLLTATAKQSLAGVELPKLAMPTIVKAQLLDMGTQFAEAVAKLTTVVLNADDGEDAEGAKLPDDIAKAIEGLTAVADTIAKTAEGLITSVKPDDSLQKAKAPTKCGKCGVMKAANLPCPSCGMPDVPGGNEMDDTANGVMKSFNTKLDVLTKMAADAVQVIDEDTSAQAPDMDPAKVAAQGGGMGVKVSIGEPGTSSADMDPVKTAGKSNDSLAGIGKAISDALKPLLTRMDGLEKQIGSAAQVAKAAAAQAAKVAKASGASSQIPVEPTGKPNAPVSKVVWPLDMNNDQTDPTKIDKSVSFYE